MPIYEYRRPDGTVFEVLQSFSAPTLTEDPETGVPVERVFSAPAIHFKGSGFHNTDYGKRKRGKDGESGDGGGSGDGGEKKGSGEGGAKGESSSGKGDSSSSSSSSESKSGSSSGSGSSSTTGSSSSGSSGSDKSAA